MTDGIRIQGSAQVALTHGEWDVVRSALEFAIEEERQFRSEFPKAGGNLDALMESSNQCGPENPWKIPISDVSTATAALAFWVMASDEVLRSHMTPSFLAAQKLTDALAQGCISVIMGRPSHD